MLVYRCGFESWPERKPLTEHTNFELLQHLWNEARGRIGERLYENQEGVTEQIRIILFAREMGWL